MDSLLKKLLLFSIFLIFAFSTYNLQLTTYNSSVHAQSSDELETQLKEKQKQIEELEGQLSHAKEQEKTLNSQLKFIDGQTKLTELKIAQTEFQITKLNKEIDDLENRITRLSTTVDSLTEVLLKRIIETYKYSNYSPLELVFSSKSFSDLINRVQYVQVAQANDKKVLYQLQATKTTYNDQKKDKETRQAEQQKLQKDLEKYQIQLTDQKKAKDELLRATQNDEAKFQQLIAKLKADTDSISRALAGKGVELGHRNRGDRIASVGNSGCSTGSHLHFEVMTPAHVENGLIIGRENKVDPKPYLDSGKFAKPVSDYNGQDCSQSSQVCNNGNISTRFGQVYFLGTHSGLDIPDFYGASIFAVDDGDAYSTSDSRACYLTGTVGKGVFMDHHNGIVTLYWHIP